MNGDRQAWRVLSRAIMKLCQLEAEIKRGSTDCANKRLLVVCTIESQRKSLTLLRLSPELNKSSMES